MVKVGVEVIDVVVNVVIVVVEMQVLVFVTVSINGQKKQNLKYLCVNRHTRLRCCHNIGNSRSFDDKRGC